jgi:hypothetical protein
VLAALGSAVTYAVAGATSAPYRPMMGGGYGMMGAGGVQAEGYLRGAGPVSTIAQARARAQAFGDRLGLTTGEVMQFANNFYVLLKDAGGKPATEVLVDPRTGDVTIEYGPAMMWNTEHGMMRANGASGSGGMMGRAGTGGMMGGGAMMRGGGTTMGGGMMGGYGGSPSWAPRAVAGPVDVDRARSLANRWLSRQAADLRAGDADALPGYFTFEVLAGGKISGMLSVNERTGAVLYHWWHGAFVAMEE